MSRLANFRAALPGRLAARLVWAPEVSSWHAAAISRTLPDALDRERVCIAGPVAAIDCLFLMVNEDRVRDLVFLAGPSFGGTVRVAVLSDGPTLLRFVTLGARGACSFATLGGE